MTREELIYKVRVKIEELSPYGDSSFVNTGGLVKPITATIDDILDETCNEVLQQLPLYVIDSADFSNEPVTMTSERTGFVDLPNDFLRLHAFKMASWKREVSVPITKQNPLYALQHNPYTMGGVINPVCVLNTYGGKKVLEYYSVPKHIEHEVVKAEYIKRFDQYNIQESIVNAYTLRCAGKVFGIFGKPNEKTLVDKEYELLLQTYII